MSIAKTPSPVSDVQTEAARVAWYRSTLAYGLLGGLLFWAALPPLEWWPLAWVAPLPWLLLVRRERLPGRRPYRALGLAGFACWLLVVHWLRLPHWATHFAWLALAAYLAFYLPVFVGLTRVGVHSLGLSVVVVAPVVWTGLELARAHFLTGFLLAALGHTQYRWIELIQISDLAGGYAVSFVVMLVAACIARMWPLDGGWPTVWPLVPAAVVLAAAVAYGRLRTSGETARPGPKVALVQGWIDASWKADPNRAQTIYDHYVELSVPARPGGARPDLVVWPETMFRTPLFHESTEAGEPVTLPERFAERKAVSLKLIAETALFLKAPLLFGIDSYKINGTDTKRFNSAAATDREGQVVGRYDKMHLVMFGEYVPFAKYFPWLYRLTPLQGGMESGRRPVAIRVGDYRYAPNICFESVVPHLICGQVRALEAQGEPPDVLVNLTNDAWFWGSSELEMHLVCGVFRAVECRRPFLVAANRGLSAVIDADGRILKRGPRHKAVLMAGVPLDDRRSPYLRMGDWPAGVCLAGCVALAIIGLWQRRRAHME